jgi:hypothetical protein
MIALQQTALLGFIELFCTSIMAPVRSANSDRHAFSQPQRVEHELETDITRQLHAPRGRRGAQVPVQLRARTWRITRLAGEASSAPTMPR